MSACCIQQVQKRELPTGTVENYVQLQLQQVQQRRQVEGRLEGSGRCGWTLEWVCFTVRMRSRLVPLVYVYVCMYVVCTQRYIQSCQV